MAINIIKDLNDLFQHKLVIYIILNIIQIRWLAMLLERVNLLVNCFQSGKSYNIQIMCKNKL